MDLTAGNDTRLLAAALAERPDIGANLTFRVLGTPISADVRISARIAHQLGWQHVVCPRVIDELTTELLPSIALAADGSFHCSTLPIGWPLRPTTGLRHGISLVASRGNYSAIGSGSPSFSRRVGPVLSTTKPYSGIGFPETMT